MDKLNQQRTEYLQHRNQIMQFRLLLSMLFLFLHISIFSPAKAQELQGKLEILSQHVTILINENIFEGADWMDRAEVNRLMGLWEEDMLARGYRSVERIVMDLSALSPQQVRNLIIQGQIPGSLQTVIVIGEFPVPSFEINNTYLGPNLIMYSSTDSIFDDTDEDGLLERTVDEDSFRNLADNIVGVIPVPPGDLPYLERYLGMILSYRGMEVHFGEELPVSSTMGSPSNRIVYWNPILLNDPVYAGENTASIMNAQVSAVLSTLPGWDVSIVDDSLPEGQVSQFGELMRDSSNGHALVLVSAHGIPFSQWIGRDIWITSSAYDGSNTFLTVLLSCNVGDLTQRDFLAGRILGDGSLLVSAYPSTAMVIGDSPGLLADSVSGLTPLPFGVEGYLVGTSSILFGDPTLSYTEGGGNVYTMEQYVTVEATGESSDIFIALPQGLQGVRLVGQKSQSVIRNETAIGSEFTDIVQGDLSESGEGLVLRLDTRFPGEYRYTARIVSQGPDNTTDALIVNLTVTINQGSASVSPSES